MLPATDNPAGVRVVLSLPAALPAECSRDGTVNGGRRGMVAPGAHQRPQGNPLGVALQVCRGPGNRLSLPCIPCSSHPFHLDISRRRSGLPALDIPPGAPRPRCSPAWEPLSEYPRGWDSPVLPVTNIYANSQIVVVFLVCFSKNPIECLAVWVSRMFHLLMRLLSTPTFWESWFVLTASRPCIQMA